MTDTPQANPDATPEQVLIFRGVGKEHTRDRIGRWWSTDPYYALHYANGSEAGMFVASVDPQVLIDSAHDASIDADYQNYIFPEDPAGARAVTAEEVKALNDARGSVDLSDVGDDFPGLGRGMVKHPDNAVEIGRTIFAGTAAGNVALSQGVQIDSV